MGHPVPVRESAMNPNAPFSQQPTAARPLAGLTVLVVEDSRFASEALRLLCLRSGARIRRADSLAHARRHLMAYRPGCIIVDLGLPDGPGTELIAALAQAQPRIGAIIGTSGDPGGEARARAAGADGYLAKPVASLGLFQATVLSLLPDRRRPLPYPQSETPVAPDPLAYRDDLRHAAGLLAGPEGPGIGYVAQFLAGIASSAGDGDLSRAAAALGRLHAGGQGRARHALHDMVSARLAQAGPL